MNKVFAVEICNKDQEAELQLPATDYQLLDIIERLEIIEEVKPSVCIYQYGEGFDNLKDAMEHDDLDLFELNALAKRLSQFELEDMIAFHALVSTRLEQRDADIPVQELLNFAHGTNCCEVHPGVETPEELGRFYVESDLIPELKEIPEKSLPFLDYKAIGEKFIKEECGVLVPGGYVTQTSEIAEVAKNMTFAPPTPNYTILLELEREGLSARLPLPTQTVEIDRVLRSIDSFGWSDPLLQVTCLDCAAPSLIPILGGRDRPDDLMTADELKSMPKGHFIVMKTGMHPMQVTLRLFLDWGITFGKPYEVPEQAQRPVAYASRKELEATIYKSTHPEQEAKAAPSIEPECPPQGDPKQWKRDKKTKKMVVEED